MTFQEKKKYGDSKKKSGFQETGERETGMNRWSSGELLGTKAILYDIVMVDTCHYIFVQAYRTEQQKERTLI